MRAARLTALIPFLWVQALFVGCKNSPEGPNAGAPPPLKVEHVEETGVFPVDRPDKFPLTVAT